MIKSVVLLCALIVCSEVNRMTMLFGHCCCVKKFNVGQAAIRVIKARNSYTQIFPSFQNSGANAIFMEKC